MELKDKIAKDIWERFIRRSFSVIPLLGQQIEDAIAALMVLGYTQGEVVPLLAKLDPNLPSQELIKQTLRQIGAASNRR
ncbi:MAG: hypothetical protein ACLUT1_04160 [Ruminococcus sp.]